MPTITSIPPRFVSGFVDLALLEEDRFNLIESNLNQTTLTSSIQKIAEVISESIDEDEEELTDIFMSIGSLMSLVDKGLSLEEISSDIYRALLNSMPYDFEDEEDAEEEEDSIKRKIEKVGLEVFSSRIRSLMKSDHLFYASKAIELMHEHQNVFLGAKALTDIRPIFKANVDIEPSVALIVHNLHIHFKQEQEGPHKDIFIALDSSDLQNLKELILRAERKEATLKKVIDKSGLINLNE